MPAKMAQISPLGAVRGARITAAVRAADISISAPLVTSSVPDRDGGL
jgi:hypothetical protein